MGASGLVLVHSPLLGPNSWQPVAGVLRGRGWEVAVPSLLQAIEAPPPLYRALARTVADLLAESAAGGVMLVVHSAAGALVPSIVEAAPRATVGRVVFVDATLPHPGRPWTETVPAEMAQRLLATADPDGSLPPWHEWFPPRVLTEVVPNEQDRALLVADIPRLPRRYLEEAAPELVSWRSLPCGYVQLSDSYNDAAERARRSGWPVTRVHGTHLSGLTEPMLVADAIEAIAGVHRCSHRPAPADRRSHGEGAR